MIRTHQDLVPPLEDERGAPLALTPEVGRLLSSWAVEAAPSCANGGSMLERLLEYAAEREARVPLFVAWLRRWIESEEAVGWARRWMEAEDAMRGAG